MDARHPLITRRESVMTGKPCIRDTRVPVDLILRKLAAGASRDDILAEHEQISAEDFGAAMAFAADLVAARRQT